MPTASHRPHIRIVQSRQNSRVKELRAGFAHGHRSETGRVSIEGLHLIEEALRCGVPVPVIFVRAGSERLLDKLDLPTEAEVLELPEELFASVVATEASQGVAALIEARAFSLHDLFPDGRNGAETASASAPLFVITDGLQDPGNLGTLIRSSHAFGASGVIAFPGTASHWNAKALRASAGSTFHLPVVAAPQAEAVSLLRKHGVSLLAATAAGGIDAAQLDLTRPLALLIGNEGAGLSDQLKSEADECITIPCPGPVESLNAAVAASILLYEAARQRRVSGANQGKKDRR